MVKIDENGEKSGIEIWENRTSSEWHYPRVVSSENLCSLQTWTIVQGTLGWSKRMGMGL